ncbi:MAG: ATP-binding protein [Chloroflexi bacterium]|nr:ATP-binding protein [Chloroflexota bacterium]MCY3588220.1 ATP-binding protein [Chloroflexota bacterium]MCY3687075.1 ATP-binding protein [Chloroflexota bacterium]MDE2708620.1 ATP-binding protein [Chloroflexota bacterium]
MRAARWRCGRDAPASTSWPAASLARYGGLELLRLDEPTYIRLGPRGAELLFQILSELEERASLVTASSEPFAELNQTLDDSLLAAVISHLAFLDRVIEGVPTL